MREWWKIVKELKDENISTNSEIDVNDFRETLLNPEEVLTVICCVPNFNTTELLDSPI